MSRDAGAKESGATAADIDAAAMRFVEKARQAVQHPLQMAVGELVRAMAQSGQLRATTDDWLKEPVEVLDEAVKRAYLNKRTIEERRLKGKETAAAAVTAQEVYLRLLKVLGLKISSLDKFQSLGIAEEEKEDETSTLIVPPLRVPAPALTYGDVWKARMKATEDEKYLAAVMFAIRMTSKLAVAMQTNVPNSLINYLKKEMRVETSFARTKADSYGEYAFALLIGGLVVLDGKTKTKDPVAAENEAWKKFCHLVIRHDFFTVRRITPNEGESRG